MVNGPSLASFSNTFSSMIADMPVSTPILSSHDGVVNRLITVDLLWACRSVVKGMTRIQVAFLAKKPVHECLTQCF